MSEEYPLSRDVIAFAAQRGVKISLDGDDLILDGDPIPDDVLDLVRFRKRVIVALLKTPPKTCIHTNPSTWINSPDRKGWIVTHCRKCGAFIGYRPAAGAQQQEQLDLDQHQDQDVDLFTEMEAAA